MPDRQDPAEAPSIVAGFPAVLRCRFTLRASRQFELPEYPGSAWRGVLGHALRNTVCVTRQPTCDACLLRTSCIYSRVFESPAGNAGDHDTSQNLPHPFVIEVGTHPRPVPAGHRLELGLLLLGPAVDGLPYIMHAIAKAGGMGIGRDRGTFELCSVQCEAGLGTEQWLPVAAAGGKLAPLAASRLDVPPPPGAIRLEVITPLRIKGRGRLLGAREFAFLDLYRTLLWRLRNLARSYAGEEPRNPHALLAAAAQVRTVRQELAWHEWTRYSSRQRTRLQMGGVVGWLELEGDALADLWETLWLGQWLHVGKATSMGLGRYRLVAPASLPNARDPDREHKLSAIDAIQHDTRRGST
jgi:hypothetical protein